MESDTWVESDFYLVSDRPRPFARYYSSDDGDWGDGVRPPHICETPADVATFLHGNPGVWEFPTPAPRPVIACGFCGLRKRLESKNTDTAVRWLTGHTCEAEGEDIETWLARNEEAA